jgi:hypothetical protein
MHGAGRVVFAAVLLLIAGTLNIIHGNLGCCAVLSGVCDE